MTDKTHPTEFTGPAGETYTLEPGMVEPLDIDAPLSPPPQVQASGDHWINMRMTWREADDDKACGDYKADQSLTVQIHSSDPVLMGHEWATIISTVAEQLRKSATIGLE